MTKKIILKNGMTLCLVPAKNLKSVTINIMAKTGFRTEESTKKGIAHLLEHMFFKGGKKYPKTIDVAKAIDGRGGIFNAMTDVEVTGYWIKINPAHIEVALDVLSDMLFHAQIAETELTKEKNVVLEELKMYKNDPYIYSQRLIYDLLFKNSPLSYDLEKENECVRKITRKDLFSFIQEYYYPQNLIVCIAGNFDQKKAIKLTNKYFGYLSDEKNLKNRIKFKKFQDNQKIKRTEIKERTDINQMFIQLAFKSFARESNYFFPMQLLHAILGASMSSRLFIDIREKHGLCYDIHTYEEGYDDTGMFGISLATSEPDKALKLINKELVKIKKEKPSDKEVKKVKELIKGKLLLNLEDSFFVNMFWGEQFLLAKKYISPEEYIKKINRVTAVDILKAANLIFQKDKTNLAIVGPYNKIDPFIKELNF